MCAATGAVKNKKVMIMIALADIPISCQNNAVPKRTSPTPNVDAFVVADIRVKRSGILIIPIADIKMKNEPRRIIIPLIISITFLSSVQGNMRMQPFRGMQAEPQLFPRQEKL